MGYWATITESIKLRPVQQQITRALAAAAVVLLRIYEFKALNAPNDYVITSMIEKHPLDYIDSG